MTHWDKLNQAVTQFSNALGERLPDYPQQRLSAELGRTPGGLVESDKPGYYWARVTQWGSSPTLVWNAVPHMVGPAPDLPIFLGYTPQAPFELQIIGINWWARGGPGNWATDGVIPTYGVQWVQKRQILDFRGFVQAGSAFTIQVNSDWFPFGEQMTWFGGATVDLTSYVPAANSLFVQVYLALADDGAGGISATLGVAAGEEIVILGPGGYPGTTDEVENYIPAIPARTFPCLAVLLRSSATAITETDCWDTRSLWNSAGYMPSANAVGQVLLSTDGSTFSVQLPLTSPSHGWLVNANGYLLIKG